MPRGGTRPNFGPKNGATYAPTLSKAEAREAGRAWIQAQMRRLVGAQIEAACGLAHLMLRQADGTWRRAPDKMTAADVEAVLNGNPDRYWISLKDSNTQAFATLAAYAWDKPKPQEIEVSVRGERDVVARLARACQRGRDRTP